MSIWDDEKKKYEDIKRKVPAYGHKGHFRPAAERIAALNIQSVCDVGTGGGEFCDWMVDQGCNYVTGVDITGGEYQRKGWCYFVARADELPLDTKTSHYVTAFDVLEHLPPDKVEVCLREWYRIASKGFVFSIATFPDSYTDSDGVVQQLHLTIQPEQWWIDRLLEWFPCTVETEPAPGNPSFFCYVTFNQEQDQ